MSDILATAVMFTGFYTVPLLYAIARRVLEDRRNAREMEAFRCSQR